MANNGLTKAKNAKNDEFYTQFNDIQKEITAYVEYNPDVFRGKTVLLPCDDPEWSNFTRFFAQNFERLGLKKLISTSYATDSKFHKNGRQVTLFEETARQYDQAKTSKHGKLFTLTGGQHVNGDGGVDVNDLQWTYLEGDGDFRSREVAQLRDEADIIITNPPFSLFRDFLAWIMEAGKQFVVVGNINAITYKELFPFLRENRAWLGATNFNNGMYFTVPADFVYADSYKFGRELDGEKVNRVPGVCWYTNLDHGRRHQGLPLMSVADNLKYSKHKEINGAGAYQKYDNFDAIEVPFTDAIPGDFAGVMGVPITFLDKYCPAQFEIVGMCENEDLYSLKTRVYSREECKAAYVRKFGKKGSYDLNASGVVTRGGQLEKVYQRILIKHRTTTP